MARRRTAAPGSRRRTHVAFELPVMSSRPPDEWATPAKALRRQLPAGARQAALRAYAQSALAACRQGQAPRPAVAALVAEIYAAGLLTYSQIAALLGCRWLEIPELILDAAPSRAP